MSKQGVYKISGNTKPKVGETVTYTIDEWYPATPREKRNPALVTWHLFKKVNGSFVPTTIKKKGISSFTFQNTAYKNTYRIEAYLHEPEGKAPMALEVQPQQGDVPRINGIQLKYADNTPGNVFSFTEKLIAESQCTGLEGKYLTFTLWEDDIQGNGHDARNMQIDRKKGKVISGVAKAEFTLTSALMKKAMQGETDVKQLEFYVTVEYYEHKKHASGNVHINTPQEIYIPSNKPKPKPAPPNSQPKVEGSPAEQKGPSQKEKKGIIETTTETISGVVSKIEKKIYDWGEAKGTVKKDQKPAPPPPSGKSPTVVNANSKAPSTCICKEQYKDLIWGGKVSCEFRKKVVEVAKRLEKDPNLLMAGMALETGKTFSPTAGKGTSYVGLIQFGDAAAESVGTTRTELLKMTAVQQLDYVEKYLAKKKDKINTLTDFYLSILMPVDVGKGNQPNHIVFDNKYPLAYTKSGKLTDLSKSRHYGYRQNPAFFFEGELHKNIKVKRSNGKTQTFQELYNEKKVWFENGEKQYDGEGKTYIWEIEKSISKFYEEGKLNKVKLFECNKSETSTAKPTLDKGTWNVIITENYTGSKCTHIERTEVRKNCRRGKIEVYDHNQKIVLTFKDCLLEGIAGEDHMKTNSDVPFGEFQINQSTPFYQSNKDNIKSYGPNPRLVFEPIAGNKDEAAKSGRSAIRIHGGRQEGYEIKTLKRTQGCIRVWDDDAKALYDWWVEFKKNNPNVKPGKVTIKK
ncbi:L,D-transpeptidase [Chryseobacterium sp. RG1]|uniref:L,D-transpeptidase n=1 Tax=Chryseobacterium tagetis TaxID=2801334 RepID=A0ABS8A445_9FLAO|nr:L,D-transpeptidase [Chryseobacterium tagetis]MCA6068759.1 L,D-transpeptidase [Chryseobacterium tagetis]